MFFISKNPSGYAIYCRNARVIEMQNFTPPYMKGWTYVRTYSVWTIFSEPKFFGCVDLPNFLTHGAPLRALRFLRTKIFWKRRFTQFSYPRCSAARASRARTPLWKGGAVIGLWYFPVVWDRNERWCRNIRGEIHPWHDSNSVSGMYVWSKSVYIQFWLC